MPILFAPFFTLSVGSKRLKQPNLDKTEHFCVWEDGGITTKWLQLCLFLSFIMFAPLFLWLFVFLPDVFHFSQSLRRYRKYFWLEGDVTKRKRVCLTGWSSSHPFQCWFGLTRCQVVFNGFNVYGNRLNHHPEAQIHMANMGWPIVLWSFPQYSGCVL